MNPEVAAVIVAYRSNAELPGCLGALRGMVGEAVVVDNGAGSSAPPTLRQAHPWVRWVDNQENRGFAAAVNQGVDTTSAPLVLLLNPDCQILSGVEALVEACGPSDVAGAGGLLVNMDGSPQTGFFARSLPSAWTLAFEAVGLNGIWKRNPINRRYRLTEMDPATGQDVEQPAGAFLLLRRQALEAVGGLDECFYPAWWEDVDLCRRLRDSGYRLRFAPRATARHIGGHSFRELPLQERLEAWYGGMLRYAKRHYPHRTYRLVRLGVLAGLALRSIYSCSRRLSCAEAGTYYTVLRLARSGFPIRNRPKQARRITRSHQS